MNQSDSKTTEERFADLVQDAVAKNVGAGSVIRVLAALRQAHGDTVEETVLEALDALAVFAAKEGMHPATFVRFAATVVEMRTEFAEVPEADA